MTSAIPNKIGAMKSITVPYRITRRITTASLFKSLFEEITGYGGGNCVKNFNITIKGKCVICPNSAYARVVEKIANFILSLFYDCPTTITPSTPPTYTLPGGTQIYINTTSTAGQGTGGNISGTSTTPIQTSNPCNCKDEGTSIEECKECRNNQPTNKAEGTLCKDDGNVCTADKCIGGICTHQPEDGKILLDLDLHDCQQWVCVGSEPRALPDDSQWPKQSLLPCIKYICQEGNIVVLNDDNGIPIQASSFDCKKEVCFGGTVFSRDNPYETTFAWGLMPGCLMNSDLLEADAIACAACLGPLINPYQKWISCPTCVTVGAAMINECLDKIRVPCGIQDPIISQ